MNKKIIVLAALLVVFLIPFKVLAVNINDYNTMDFIESLSDEDITPVFNNYEPSDDAITIYLFRGKGCSFCQKFLSFMNNITPEYGIYFKMVSFEIWNDTKNKELYDEVISFYEDKSSIVPFIIIGNEVFTGYNANNASKIEKAITDLYNTPKDERYDIMQELDKTSIADDANSIIKCESPNNTNVIVISIALLIIASSVFIVTMQTVRYRYVRNEFEYLQSDIDSLKEKINNLKGRQVIKKSPRKTNTKKDKNK